MIYFDDKKSIVAISKYLDAFSKRVLLEIRKGSRIIWTSVRSCFGGGSWDNDRPWIDEDGWKD